MLNNSMVNNKLTCCSKQILYIKL